MPHDPYLMYQNSPRAGYAGSPEPPYLGAGIAAAAAAATPASTRQLELMVAAHETELGGIRNAMGRSDAERRLASAAAGQVAEEVANMGARLLMVERAQSSSNSPVTTAKAVQVGQDLIVMVVLGFLLWSYLLNSGLRVLLSDSPL
jgi:hypothetical protein